MRIKHSLRKTETFGNLKKKKNKFIKYPIHF